MEMLLRGTERVVIFILWPRGEQCTKPDSGFMERKQNEILANGYISKYKSAIDLYFIFQENAVENKSGSLHRTGFQVYELYTHLQSFLIFKHVRMQGNLICFESILGKLGLRNDMMGLEVPAVGKVSLMRLQINKVIPAPSYNFSHECSRTE